MFIFFLLCQLIVFSLISLFLVLEGSFYYMATIESITWILIYSKSELNEIPMFQLQSLCALLYTVIYTYENITIIKIMNISITL